MFGVYGSYKGLIMKDIPEQVLYNSKGIALPFK